MDYNNNNNNYKESPMVLMLGKLAAKFIIKILITKKEGDCPGADVHFVSTLENCQKS